MSCAIPAVWSDADIDWASFAALVIRSPWDYFERAAEFRAWLDARIASGVLMCNAGDILDWNYDKRYLQDLEAAGVPLVPTLCIRRGEQADVAARARARGWNEIVVKPTISGGGYRTYRFFVDDAAAYTKKIDDTLADRGVLVQPFLAEILSDGELSILFFDGVYSHAVCSGPSPAVTECSFTAAPLKASKSSQHWWRKHKLVSWRPRRYPSTLASMAWSRTGGFS